MPTPNVPRRFRRAYPIPVGIALLAAALSLGAAEPEDMEKRIDALVARMTIEEKVGQLIQIGGDANSGGLRPGQEEIIRRGQVGTLLDVRGAGNVNAAQKLAIAGSPLKIPLLFGYDVVHGYRTIFPVPLGIAASWDPAMAELSARVAADEASAAGVRWTFAPMVDIARDPRWGRMVEGAGEDPYLGAAMARSYVRGFQGSDYGDPLRVVACAKHWVGYGAVEGGRDYNSAELSERTLRTVHFPPFRAARDAGVGTFMSALNALDGVPGAADRFALTDVLRGEWKFDGPVIADYLSVVQLVDHGVAADLRDAAREAIRAGIDMEEEGRAFRNLPALVADGSVSEKSLDAAVRRVLRVKFRLGLFDRHEVDPNRERRTLLNRENLDAARKVASRSLVLLKNEGKLLPLTDRVRSIAVLGPFADDRQTPLGPWFADGRSDDVTSFLHALNDRAPGRGLKITHAPGCAPTGDDGSRIAEAARIAREADVAVLVVGEPSNQSGEATSKTDLDLPGRQLDLVKAVHATGTPVVVVLMNGRPLTMNWVAENVPAILEAWFPGTQGGPAIADVLLGVADPGGKLPVTFPRSVGQIPLYYAHRNTGRPASDSKYTSKYIDSPVTALFPFGHGLSYAEFRLSNLSLDHATISRGGELVASVTATNTGDRDGEEVVQLYIRDEVASVSRPVKELKGFERVRLRPGESRVVRFPIGPEHLGFYDRQMQFVVEPGKFRVIAGTSSEGGVEAEFEVKVP